jgi:hypothetical protein
MKQACFQLAHVVQFPLTVNAYLMEVKFSLCLTKHCTKKHMGGVDVLIHVSLTSPLVGGEWSASCSGCFILGKEPQYSFDRKLQSWSGQHVELKILGPAGT